MVKRTFYETLCQILKVALEPQTIMEIRGKSMMAEKRYSSEYFGKFVATCLRMNLLQEADGEKFQTTEKGRKYVEQWEFIEELTKMEKGGG